MKTTLRDYQRSAAARLIAELDRSASALLVAPTGSGKTVMFAAVAARYVKRGLRVLVIAHRRELLKQAHDKLAAAGVRSHVHRGRKGAIPPRARVVVASAQTLGGAPPPGFAPDLVIVDEAHHQPSASFSAIVAACPGARVLGATATPWWQSEKPLDEHFAATVRAPSIRELTAAGYLARVRMFTHPHTLRDLDLRNVKTAAGDYTVAGVSERVNRPTLLGDMVEHWKTHARGARTLAFAASVEHSRSIAARFVAAGIAAEHVDGATPDAERAAVLARLESGETLVVSNYNVLSEGFDAPAVGCVILARPTKRVGVYLQCVGRGMRVGGGFDDVVILDHAGACLMHGLPEDDHEPTAKEEREGAGRVPVRRCPSCGLCVHPLVRECPDCSATMRCAAPTEEPKGALVEVLRGSEAQAIVLPFAGNMLTAAEVSRLTGISKKKVQRWFWKRRDIDEAVLQHLADAGCQTASARRGKKHHDDDAAACISAGVPPATVGWWIRRGYDLKTRLAQYKPADTHVVQRAMFRGELRTAREICAMTGASAGTVYKWLDGGVDIDEAASSYAAPRQPKQLMFRGELCTAREVYEATGVLPSVMKKWFSRDRNIDEAVTAWMVRKGKP